MLENGLALKRSERGHRRGSLSGAADGGVDRRAIGEGHARGDGATVFVGDLEIGVGIHRLVGEVIGIRRFQHDAMLRLARRFISSC